MMVIKYLSVPTLLVDMGCMMSLEMPPSGL